LAAAVIKMNVLSVCLTKWSFEYRGSARENDNEVPRVSYRWKAAPSARRESERKWVASAWDVSIPLSARVSSVRARSLPSFLPIALSFGRKHSECRRQLAEELLLVI